jgi:hypothetical protein
MRFISAFHVYNFDFASLNFAFPHLIKSAQDFKIGVSDPTFSETGPAFRYRGEADVSYVGERCEAALLCRKYQSTVPVEKQAALSGNKRGGYFQDVEIKLATTRIGRRSNSTRRRLIQ